MKTKEKYIRPCVQLQIFETEDIVTLSITEYGTGNSSDFNDIFGNNIG